MWADIIQFGALYVIFTIALRLLQARALGTKWEDALALLG